MNEIRNEGASTGFPPELIIAGAGLLGVSALGLAIISPTIAIGVLAFGAVVVGGVGVSVFVMDKTKSNHCSQNDSVHSSEAENKGANNQGKCDLVEDLKEKICSLLLPPLAYLNDDILGSSNNQSEINPLLGSLTSLKTGIGNFFDQIEESCGFRSFKNTNSINPDGPRKPSNKFQPDEPSVRSSESSIDFSLIHEFQDNASAISGDSIDPSEYAGESSLAVSRASSVASSCYRRKINNLQRSTSSTSSRSSSTRSL